MNIINNALINESAKRSKEADNIREKLRKIAKIQRNEMSKNSIRIMDTGNDCAVYVSELQDESLKTSINTLVEMAIAKEVEYLENRLKELMSGYTESEGK